MALISAPLQTRTSEPKRLPSYPAITSSRYSAPNPDVFYWAHATFFMGTILTAEHFGDGRRATARDSGPESASRG